MTAEVLLLLGCPQIPVQSPIALYIADFINDLGKTLVLAANPSAKQLIAASDPKKYYIKEYRDVDRTISDLADGKVSYPLIISLIHNDAGLTYTATAAALAPKSVMITILFGEHAYDLSQEIEFPAEKVVAPVTHNTKPLLAKIDEVLEWAALKI
ncbi:DUF1890 family protein [Methanorbis rubei]|uniref:DUF1890 domain-containing protein n=1 Tax=Methanorbis rubei TaxID=3028300 RepID=A0AAE4MFK0_9EURY|nr:hypothetical protein [Methanocorpusculaceae archaeon Cs1]